MAPDLHTTNLLLGIIAGVAVFEGLVIMAMAIGGYLAYQRAMSGVDRAMEAVDKGMLVAHGLEERAAATLHRVDTILDDVKGVTATVKGETERVDQAIHSTIQRIDDTAGRVRTNVRVKASTIVGFIRGARVALEAFART